MAITPKRRFEVLKRDSFRCAYCGLVAEASELQVDHIVPRAKGGTDDIVNLITACTTCNQGKAATPLGSVIPAVDGAAVADLADRVHRTEEYARLVVQEREQANFQRDQVMSAWCEAWGGSSVLDRTTGRFSHELTSGRFPDDRSVRTILRKLPLDRVLTFVDAIPRKFDRPYDDACRYFYGMCWRAIQSGDAQYLADELESTRTRLGEVESEMTAAEWRIDTLRDEIAEKDEIIAELRRVNRARNFDIPQSVGAILHGHS